MNSHAEHTRGLFACLGDASRYRIVAALSEGDRCVTDLARAVARSQSCTTRHLQALERVGLVAGVRQGKRVVFRLRIDDPRVGGLLEWIRADANAGAPRPARTTRSVVAEDRRTGVERAPDGRDGSAGATRPAPTGSDDTRATSQKADERAPDSPTPTPRVAHDLEDFLL